MRNIKNKNVWKYEKYSIMKIWKYKNIQISIYTNMHVEKCNYGKCKRVLQACVHYFHQIFIFSPSDSPLKTMKIGFYFI